MSKPNTTTTTPTDAQPVEMPPAAPAPPVQPPAAPAAPAEPQEGKGGNAEAAKYRRQLRDTEAERDALSGTVETLRRQLVAGAMPEMSKLSADALWNTGRNAAEFFDEATGQLDADGLASAVQETHEKLGLFMGADPIPGAGGGHSGSAVMRQQVSWADAIKQRK